MTDRAMSVIEGSSVSVKTMSDGTLRISIDIEPANAQAAFALFGAPGRAVALAALKDGSGAVNPGENSDRGNLTPAKALPGAEEKPKGGEWAKMAGMWCNDPDFWDWIESTKHNDFTWFASSEPEAANFLYQICGIESRASLDHSRTAWDRFDTSIRRPFMAWMKANGIQK